MHLDFMRDEKGHFPEIDNKDEVTSLRIWHCKYKTLEPIKYLPNLRSLVVATVPDESLSFLEGLRLDYLRILHLPKINNLSPLKGLQRLRSLSLQTLPSWDSSGKVLQVESLDPISHLSNLEHLELFGVVSPDRSLAAIENCKKLVSARFSKYPKEEIARFYAATGVSNAYAPKAEFEG
jgi:hypothetical protein